MLLGLFAAVATNIVIDSIIGGVTLGTTIYCCGKAGNSPKGPKQK